MFILNGNRLLLDRPFTHEGFQYPKEWLRCSTPEQKAELGIMELPGDTPKEHWEKDEKRVREGLVFQQKREAHRILAETDWMIIRQLETGEEVLPGVLEYRKRIREICAENEKKVDLGWTLTRYPKLVIV